MDARYDDGLDDFDRDVLGHVPLQSQRLDGAASHGQSLGYFPAPHSSRVLDSSEGDGTYYEATLLPSSRLELGPSLSSTYPVLHQRPALATGFFDQQSRYHIQEVDVKNRDATPRHYAPSERSSHTVRSSSQGPGSSSPTARFGARAQKTAGAGLGGFHTSLASSPPIHVVSGSSESSTPLVNGIPLVRLRDVLPDKFRAIFSYELLNAVQSKCFDAVYRTNDNLVVAAPTGSGKTTVLELAICKLALDRGNENFKIVYQAPTKALCSERARDWERKFCHMGLECAELTGDTSPAEVRRVGDASIIVTTPEKWDSITRKWHDHRKLLQMVELFLVDEVHILKDARGATLEAVVSRMKTIGANVRFIALSATVPNSEDIAKWLGRNHTNQQLPAHREAFGEEFRPVKLQKYVYGFESNSNDFIFDRFLDQKLPGLICRHAQRKPILIFCFTRKSCESTAVMLAEFASGRLDADKPWPVPSERVPVLSRELQEIVRFGVAFHHAGLDAQDRAAVEQNFLRGQLGVICCTSTLAVGINLPCHTVVLKGTVGFTDERLQEYSDIEVMQMLGRAGRPQFDDSATAIILTRAANRDRYQRMVSGQEVLESALHLNLIEHLNSEICLGSIHDLASAKTWLGGTFLNVRLRRNPNYYQLTGGTTSPSLIDDKLEEICERDIRKLQEAELVTNQDAFSCTEYGRAMSKYMVEFSTMKMLLQIPRGVGMESLITMLSQASEFKEFRLKPAERALFREINQSPLIMYPVKEAVNQTRHKISLMIQAHLGCVQYPDSVDAAKVRRQLMVERKLVFERLSRLVRAVIDCKGHDRDSIGTRTALELARALAAEAWEGRATQLTQVPNIGPVGMRKLASKDIRTVLQLADRDYDEIERLMSRQPPFGKTLQFHLDRFPRLDVEAAVVGHRTQPRAAEPVVVEIRATLRYLNRKGPPNWLNKVPTLTFLAETSAGTLVYFWRGSLKKLDRQTGFDLKFSAGLRDVKDRIFYHFSCEEIVGTIVSKTLEHKLPASMFPSRPVVGKTSLGNSHERDIQEYLDDEEIDDSDLILAAEQALAHTSTGRKGTTVLERDPDEYPQLEELLQSSGSHSRAENKFDTHLAAQGDEDGANFPQPSDTREPVRLPNGKWQCNHPCSGGVATRSGKPCNHRCCKEGLERPRRRPLQRPKRKREGVEGTAPGEMRSQPAEARPHVHQGSASAPLSPPLKRQRPEAMAPLTQGSFVSSPRTPTKAPTSSWSIHNLDAMNLECIDLSITDDDEAITSKHAGAAQPNGEVIEMSITGCKETFLSEVGCGSALLQDTSAQSNNPPRGATRGHSDGRSTPLPASTERGTFEDEDFDDDCFSLLDDIHSSKRSAVAPVASRAFKSGARDQMLYRGIFNESATGETTGSLAQGVSEDTRDGPNLETDPPPDEPSSSVDMRGGAEAAADELPSTSAVPQSPTSEHAAWCARPQDKASAGLKDNEPAWVAEFDAEFVDMFRGFVTFV